MNFIKTGRFAAMAFPLFALSVALLSATREARAQTSVTTPFYSTGAYQTFLVPTGVNELFIEMWGAGGAGDRDGGFGGGGGFVSGTISVSSAQSFTLLVGGGGNVDSNGSFGGGGAAIYGGGGRSGFIDTAGGAEILTAGAGGGGNSLSGPGGVGGGLVGGTGASSNNPGGTGGTQTAGGTGNLGDGSFHQGGGTTFNGSSGGGGGFYGGGGAGRAAGGGGSSFIAQIFVAGGTTVSGNGTSAGNATSADYLSFGTGNGRPVGSGYSNPNGEGSGGNGLIVVRYTLPAVVPEANTATLLGLALPILGAVAVIRRRNKKA